MTLWTCSDWRGKFDPHATLRIDTRLSPDRTLREDRAQEIAEYTGFPLEQVEKTYRVHHELRGIRLKPVDESSVEGVLAAYTDGTTLGWLITRFMLHYTRLESALQLLLAMRSIRTLDRPLRVIDFGCGAADFGLLFALNGADVTLVDVEHGILRFAEWRLRRRGLNVQTVAVNADNIYPTLPKADLAIAGDVLEHLVDPPASIRHIHRALEPGGHFWFPDFPYEPKAVGGMHIRQAADLREAAAQTMDELFGAVEGPKYLRVAKPHLPFPKEAGGNVPRRAFH